MLLSLLSKRSLEVDSRDAYGFALRPQHLQGYKDHVFIYKEEEDERSDRWKTFLEQQLKSALSSSPEDVCIETSHAEATTQKEEIVSDRSKKGDDTSSRESASSGSTEKEVESTKETKSLKVQTWVQIKPSLGAIDHMMGSRVKTRKNTIDEQKNDEGDHLSSSTEVEPVWVVHEENFENYADKVSDDTEKHSTVRRDEGNGLSSEPSFPWKEELECLVRGGVPKELRGEVWQAFLGVRTRRVERYYEDLLADTDARGINKHDKSPGTPTHWIKQIEKDIPRTFPGHPALDDNGRNSLRRLLLAYSRHNPSVGYCQAMNYFAGLLLLLMPEENAFWALVGIIDDYFEGYYTEQMIESQVDQLVLEELVHERFPKLVNHLDYLGVQVTWITGSWFLSIFVNMLPWESVLRVWDVLLYEGNRVMLFRSALALIELYGPALATTKDAGDAITLLQSLAGSTFDGSQLVMTACMSFQCVTEARLQELREKHRPTVLRLIEERSKRAKALIDSRGVKSKLYSLKQDHAEKETRFSEGLADDHADGDASLSESHEVFILPNLQEQVDRLKVEICRVMEDNRSAVLRAEVLETALAEMAKEDNRPQLIMRIEQLEKEIEELRKIIYDTDMQEVSMIEVLLRVEQQQRETEDARILAERNTATQQFEVNLLEDKYEKALSTVAWMEKKVIMAESMLEATLQYECGQIKAQASPGHSGSSSTEIPSPSKEGHIPTKEGLSRNSSLLSRPFALGWGDKNKGNATDPQTNPED